jgi:hypothetical protein
MSANRAKYYQRKALGICVRCEGPVYANTVLCLEHLNYSRRQRKAKKPDDSPDALPCAIEPPRAPYQPDIVPVMPPAPKCCPRCANLVLTADGDSFCYACGWHLSPIWPPLPPENRGRKYEGSKTGAQLPVVMEA